MIGRALVLALLFGVANSVRAFEPLTDPYRATAGGAVGAVTGRLYEERRRPEAPDHPLAGASVILLPRSAELLGKLEEIKRVARTSAGAYREAVPSILALRRAHEKGLWESGAADLVKATVSDADGRFALVALPAGDWVLIATHSVRADKQPAGRASKQQRPYAPGTRLMGYQWVTVWLREVVVSSGGSASVELAERGAWFSGVVEDRAPDTGR